MEEECFESEKRLGKKDIKQVTIHVLWLITGYLPAGVVPKLRKAITQFCQSQLFRGDGTYGEYVLLFITTLTLL